MIPHPASAFARGKALIAFAQLGQLGNVVAVLAAGINVHTQDDAVLCQSARYGHLEVVRTLIAAGANINAWNGFPIYWAAQNGHAEVVCALVLAGATHQYGAALSAAAQGGHVGVLRVPLAAKNGNLYKKASY